VGSRRRYSFFIDDQLAAGLKALKDRDGTPEAEAVRRAIADFLAKSGISAKKTKRKPAATRRRA
jgi:hypothetical protein